MESTELKRLIYYKGQHLTAQDFNDQQEYHRKRFSQFVARFSYGIIRGLKVEFKPGNNIPSFDAFKIKGGLAMDDDGEVLIVPEEGIYVDTAEFDENSPYLNIKYEEKEDKVVHSALLPPKRNNRKVERVIHEWDSIPNRLSKNIITVARIIKNVDGSFNILHEDAPGELKIRIDAALVDEDQILDGAVTSPKIAKANPAENKGIRTDHIRDKAVAEPKIADDAISPRTIQDDAVISSKIEGSAVTEPKIAGLAVSTRNIQDNAVISSKIAKANVAENKGIQTDHIRDNAVAETKIADVAVSTRTIQDDAVLSSKIEDGAVTEDKISDNAVTRDKIANGNVASEKLSIMKRELSVSTSDTNPITQRVFNIESDAIIQVVPTSVNAPLSWSISKITVVGSGLLNYELEIHNFGSPADLAFEVRTIKFGKIENP